MDLGDNSKPFIWNKKYKEQGVNVDDPEVRRKIEQDVKIRIEENKLELAKIKEQNERRELEIQQKINDSEFLLRQREAREHGDWEQKEDQFIFKQHRQRSRIRIRDGRAKPIDFFAHYVDVFGEKQDEDKTEIGRLPEEKIDLSDSPVELLNPCDWFNGMRQTDLEALEEDIVVYMKADCRGNQHYWNDLLDITKNEASKLRAVKEDSKKINPILIKDVMSMFEHKNTTEMDDMEDEINCFLKAETDNPAIDKGLYEEVISRLRAYRAEERLTAGHNTNLERLATKKIEKNEVIKDKEGGGQEVDEEEEDEDREAEERETKFSCEAPVEVSETTRRSRPTETGKYQSRKPLYSNSVRTGFEWNKYNKTHYDIDNPPPRVVQGYKFNIFYPDLIDKSKAPQFTITPCGDDKDFCTVRFSAGPPYEDIAFKIVNREWNTSHKSGYKCQFSGNILQLYFRFKRYRYRR